MKIRVDPKARHILWRQMERYVERLLSYPPGTKRIGMTSLDDAVLNLLEKSLKLGDHVSHLRLLEHFAEKLQHSSNLDILDRHLTKALAQEMSNEQQVKLACLHVRLLTQRGELERAEVVLEEAWSAADTPLLQVELYNRQAILRQVKEKYTESKEAYTQALALAQEDGTLYQVTSIYNNLGNWAFAQDKYEKALDYYQQALQVAEELNQPIPCARAEGGLAMTLGMLKRYEAAKPYHELARQHYEQSSNRFGVIRVDLNRCYFAILQEKYEEAQHLASSARIEAHKLANLEYEALALHNLGKIFLHQGDYESACQQLTQALEMRKLLGISIYEKTTRDLIQELAKKIKDDSKINRALQLELLKRCEMVEKGAQDKPIPL